jgi:hypothetical protein
MVGELADRFGDPAGQRLAQLDVVRHRVRQAAVLNRSCQRLQDERDGVAIQQIAQRSAGPNRGSLGGVKRMSHEMPSLATYRYIVAVLYLLSRKMATADPGLRQNAYGDGRFARELAAPRRNAGVGSGLVETRGQRWAFPPAITCGRVRESKPGGFSKRAAP